MKTNLTRETLSIFWRHSKRYPWHIAAVLIGVTVYTVGQIYPPLLYRDLINMLAKGAESGTVAQAVYLILVILIINLVRTTLWRVSNLVNTYFQAGVMRDLMNTCYQYLQHHSASFFSSNFVGSLVTRVKRYEKSFETIADQITFDFGRSLFDTAIVIGILLWQYRVVGYVLLGWAVLYMVITYAYARFKMPYDVKRAASDTHTTAQLADSITNNVNIKLFTNYDVENERFRKVTDEQFEARRMSWNLAVIGDTFQSVFMILLEFAVIYLALGQWEAGVIAVGDIALLQAYLLRIFDKLWNAGKNIQRIYEALADANEMTQMILTEHEVQDSSAAYDLVPKNGEIEFKNVSFGYHKESAILDDFNLTIAPGERVAFVGSSGGGKSTIAKLLFRFHDLDHGTILIDGQNIAEVMQDSLRKALSLVPQDPILFHRSLMENIRYAKPDASDKEVLRAAKLAHAHEFISSFTNGYDTLVGERGIKLSGGERQRVAIARAILKNAPILVLDEATSSLDSQSEMYIQDALQKLMQGRTTIVIAHRLSTIMQMDRIVVIDDGKIIEEGKHDELLKARQGIYQKLWEIQAGGFVAAT